MIEVYKILTAVYFPRVSPELARNINSRTRGNSLKLLVRQSRLDLRRFSFCEHVVNIWNSLPNWVVESQSVNMFRNNFDKFSKTKDLLYNFEADW